MMSSSPLVRRTCDELVVVADLDRDDAVGLDRRVVGAELGLLDHALAGGEDEVLALAEVARGLHGPDELALAQRQHVHERAALGRARRLGQLVDLLPVDLAAVGEEEQEVVRRADEEVLDVVLVLHVHAGDADAAALLLAVGGERQRLDVAGLRDRDDHLLVGDQVLDVHVVLGEGDLGAPLVAVALLDLEQLLLDQAHHARLVAEDLAQLLDPLERVRVLLLDLVRLERGEPLEAQVEDRLGLDLREAELVHQAVARRLRVARAADQLDDGVEVLERDQQALEDVQPRLALAQLVLGAPDDDVALVVDVVADQRHAARACAARRRPARPCSRRRCSAAACACRAC